MYTQQTGLPSKDETLCIYNRQGYPQRMRLYVYTTDRVTLKGYDFRDRTDCKKYIKFFFYIFGSRLKHVSFPVNLYILFSRHKPKLNLFLFFGLSY